MVLQKNAKINGLYVLNYKSRGVSFSDSFVSNVFLVKLTGNNTYGGKTNPVIEKLVRIKPGGFGIINIGRENQYQWKDIYSPGHIYVRKDIQFMLQYTKRLSETFKRIFKKAD